MIITKHEIFKLLLDLHKFLLEGQKADYEKKYGSIANANQYFQLVVSHEDFDWLRKLSALIASFDEILESDEQDISAVSKELILLLENSDEDFYQHLKTLEDNNPLIISSVKLIIQSLKNPA